MPSETRLDETLIFHLTDEGRAEMLHRRFGVARELRFVMMLIDGRRDLKTLRMVSDPLRDSDEPLLMLRELGLIDADMPSTAPVGNHPAAEVGSTHAPDPAAERRMIDDGDFALQIGSDDEVPTAAVPIEAMITATEPWDVSSSQVPAPTAYDAERDMIMAIPAQSATATAERVDGQAAVPIRIDPAERDFVAEVLDRAMGSEAKPLIAQLRAVECGQAFIVMVRRLESTLREQVSIQLAEQLRARMPSLFG